ncbi:hypothetical protein cand_027100 [Cryptosporidium andersoni]|uniref:Uncharacterized protein n=1 Tax=Cryptosporidium andersoni TaxID=117008 RepID=A0A1J4MSI6_9CRYT|nr:hypothetical protein cand_027100 [Cryptosporidium andersoni]
MYEKIENFGLELLENICKTESLLTNNEIVNIHKCLKKIADFLKGYRGKLSLFRVDVLEIYNLYGISLDNFVTNFNFCRIRSQESRRSIAKYSYYILICIIDIVSRVGEERLKVNLVRSCHICLKYYIPSKALSAMCSLDKKKSLLPIESPINKLNDSEVDKYESIGTRTPITERRNTILDSPICIPSPSPFHGKSPVNYLYETTYIQKYDNDVTKYNIPSGIFTDSPKLVIENVNHKSFDFTDISDSEFFPKSFASPLPIVEMKQKMIQKKKAESLQNFANLRNTVRSLEEDNTLYLDIQEQEQIPSSCKINNSKTYIGLNKHMGLNHSWESSRSDKSDLQIEDLASFSHLSMTSLRNKNYSNHIYNDLWEAAEIAAELAESLPEPQRTLRIRREVYQQSVDRSVELMMNLGVCHHLRPTVLSKTMYHTIECILDL